MKIKDFLSGQSYRYYYSKCTDAEKKAYNAILHSALEFVESAPCWGCTLEEIQHAFECVKKDIPEIFYIKNITLSHFRGLQKKYTILLDYRFQKEEVANLLFAMQETYKPFINTHRLASAYEKERAIHDLLIDKVVYKDVDAPYSHEAPGALLYGIGVCEGIAKAFQYLASHMGLHSIVVFGTAKEGLGGDSDGGHAWNLVELEGTYYHLDVTFDLGATTSCVRYDYFNLSDAEVSIDHCWERELPVCSQSFLYYERVGQYCKGRGDLMQVIKQAFRTNTKSIVFQLPSMNANEDEVMDVITNILGKCMTGFSLSFTVSHNMKRMVFQVDL